MAIVNAQSLPYDPRVHPTFESWADLMCELYAANGLDIANPSTDWKQWGNGMLAIDIFTNQAVPTTDSYDNWQDWVNAVIGTMNSGGNT